MITVNSMKKVLGGGSPYDFELKGLSTDEKPSSIGGYPIGVNSLFLELDTKDFYYLETPAQSGTKEILIPETSFVAEQYGESHYYDFDQTEISADVIAVIFDGVEYSCEKVILSENEYAYGSEGSFIDYPFSVLSVYINEAEKWLTAVYVADDNEHTIEVYTGSPSTPAVWKKVGSGASPSPSEDGYEISNPVLTLNIMGEPTYIDETYYVDEDGYLTYGPIEAYGETKLVMVSDEGWYGIVILKPSSFSNEVNCTAEVEDDILIITITDLSQDASIDVEYGLV